MVDYTKSVAPSGNNLIDAVAYVYGWQSNNLTYGFRIQDIDNNGKSDFTEGTWTSFYQAIFNNVSSFTPLTFTRTTYEAALLNQLMEVGGGGQSSDPAPGVTQTFTQVNIAGGVADASAVVYLGHYSETWFHEVGHSLGLRHTFELPNKIDDNVTSGTDLGDHFLNSALYSVMSYSAAVWAEDNPWTAAYDPGQTILNASVGSFMPLDIAALQHIYGAKPANTGDDVCRFSDDLVADKGYRTVWDTGGVDTIHYTGTSRARIDLNAATLEKEIGGGGNDTIDGGAGTDTMIGGTGDDRYTVDDVRDQVIENRAQGQDSVFASVSYALAANVEDLTLVGSAITATGNALANAIVGNDAANILIGGMGVDVLTGGAGSDRFVFAAGDTGRTLATADRITDFSRTDRIDLRSIDAVTRGADDTFRFVGNAAFSGRAGELRAYADGSAMIIAGDTNGDRLVDLMIRLDGAVPLTAGNFML